MAYLLLATRTAGRVLRAEENRCRVETRASETRRGNSDGGGDGGVGARHPPVVELLASD